MPTNLETKDLRPVPAIPGTPNLAGYMVDADGKVWSVTSNWRGQGPRPLTPHIDRWGRALMRTHRDGARISVPVDELVAWAFHGAPPYPEAKVRHVNGDPADNRPLNLTWSQPGVTRKETPAGTQAVDLAGLTQLVVNTSLEVATDPTVTLPDTPHVRAWRAALSAWANAARGHGPRVRGMLHG